MWKCGNVEMWKFRNVEMQKCGNVEMWKCGNAPQSVFENGMEDVKLVQHCSKS